MDSITMTKINAIRDREQRLALNKWSTSGFRGSVIAGTGFGKSRLAILACEHFIYKKKQLLNEEANVIILVPTVQLQDQFVDEFHKWELEDCLDNIEILCYQSAYKLKDNKYDLVVCDEIHLGLSTEYRKFFSNNKYNNLLCMTATEPEEPEYKVKLRQLAPIVYKITLDECVKLGIVSPYSIYCKPIELTDEEKKDYKKINNQFVYYKYKLGQFDAFNEAKRIIGDKNATGQEKASAAQFYRSIRERKKIVDFAANKVTEFQKLVLKNLDKRILVFSGANDFTNKLCDSISPLGVAYHSNKTKKQRENALEAFKSGDKNVLCSTKALNQGLDVPNANMGVICGLTSKSLSMIQRVGRLIRFQEGKVGDIYILYVKESQEEKWLKSAVKNLSNIKWL